ncbi:putative disease resistance RPP13-like protein 2 [Vitis vinifera]|uniref:Putative disease resistance RPP13-like protein 2 n=1 Tax=Vitis vinifera TaxID=29760 RepID=A0A438GMT2_VITVI|nr:putative disease resistance RPP13-like protein 2 [Vitis vinifera]
MFLEREDEGGRLHSVLCCSRPASSWQYEMAIGVSSGAWSPTASCKNNENLIKKMLAEYSTRKQREEAWRMMAEGRNEEAKEMRHRNSTLKANTQQIGTQYWAEVDDSRDLVKIVLSRVIEKLCVVWIQEPAVFVGISRKAKENRKLGEVPFVNKNSQEAELIKSKIPALPHLPLFQSVANTVVSPVEEKVSALLAQEAIHPYTKKKAMRVLDKLRSLNGFLKGLESVELDDGGMVWMEELSHVCLSAVVAIEDFINRTQQLTKRSWMGPSKGFLSAFGKFKSQDKLAVEMDKIYAKIQNLSIHRPTAVNPQGQSRNPKYTLGSAERIPRQPTTQEPDLASFGDDVHAMIARLLTDDQNFRVIPIMGMQGIGKTTLANLIFNHKAVVDHFPFAAWRSDGYRFQLRNKGELCSPVEVNAECGVINTRCNEALSHKDATIEEWSTALQQFHHDQQQLWPNTLYKIHKDLSLYMRRCLFYFTLFPQDFDIPARRLITLWVAEDLVQPEGENETPEDVAERCLNLLIAQGMVQVTKKKLNGNVKMVQLPDALRQYWSSKAQQATFLGVHTNTRSELSLGTSRIRRLVDHLDKEDISFDHIHGDYNTTSTSLTPYYEDVLSFLSFDTRKESKPGEEVGNFLRQSISSGGFLVLLVLDLENVFRPKLPEAIGKLTRLRYLGLRSTFLEVLPSSISKLQNVQILDMKHTASTLCLIQSGSYNNCGTILE